MKSFTNLFILFFILVILGFLYRRFEAKRLREESKNNYKAIQEYLLDDITLGKSKKPILWIHVPYEYNSRNWLNFGSRSSFDLNQPYLYLTFRSIIEHCEESFTVCVFDDNSFEKLVPGWNVNMNIISSPILDNMRLLGMMKLLYIYGGMMCPLSFLCMKNLEGLYSKGTRGDKMFVCEMVDRNVTSTERNLFPSISFCGAPKECETVKETCDYVQYTMSNDYTAESKFLGSFDKWCAKKIQSGRMNMIEGIEIGSKTINDKSILVDDLMSNHYLDLYPGTYGIIIPSNEILNRKKYEWFARLSEKQVLESDTIIGNYLLVSIAPDSKQGILEPLETIQNKAIKKNFVGFWKTPNYNGLYGLKPNFLGDNVPKVQYTGR
jgi:hypothetical protein